MLFRLFPVLSLFFLCGCALPAPDLHAPISDQTKTGKLFAKPLVQHKGSLTVGARIRVSDPALPCPIEAVVKESYFSAAGFNCYRLKISNPLFGQEPMSLCRGKNGKWFVPERIWPYSVDFDPSK
jgi:hypothetical protein